MKKRSVLLPLFLLACVFLVFLIRRWNEPVRKEAFDRQPVRISYSSHARCRMNCRHISKNEVDEIMQKGLINFSKSNKLANPCPIFALQGRTKTGQNLRVIFSQCPNETKVITAYNLEKEFDCDCSGNGKKERR